MNSLLYVISGFRHDADEIRALLGYNAALSGNPLLMFRDNISVPSSRIKNMGLIRCPEMSVKDYHSMLRYNPKERRPHQSLIVNRTY
jgi:hypothetical protein